MEGEDKVRGFISEEFEKKFSERGASLVKKEEISAMETQFKGVADEFKLLKERFAGLDTEEKIKGLNTLVERAANLDFDLLSKMATDFTERQAKDLNDEMKSLSLDALAERAAKETADSQALQDFLGGGVRLSLRAAAPITMANIAGTKLASTINEGLIKSKSGKLMVFNHFRREDVEVPTIDYSETDVTNGETAIVVQGDLKPQLDMKWKAGSAKYDTIAGVAVFGEDILRDWTSCLREVIEFTIKDANKKLEYAVLYGGTNIKGILTTAAAFNLTTITDVNPNPQLTDTIRVGCEQIIALEQEPDTLLISRALLAKGELARDASGRLLDEQVAAMFPFLTIVPFVPKAGDEDKFAVLDSDYFKTRLRKPVNGSDPMFDIVIERQKDDLQRNQVTARAEVFAFGYHPSIADAYCMFDSFATIKAAITVTP